MRRTPRVAVRFPRALLTASCAGLLCSCSLLQGGPGQMEEMVRSVREFNNDLRWGRYDLVGPVFAPAVRRHYAERLTQMGDQLQIVDLEIVNLNLDPVSQGQKAQAQVEVSWMPVASNVVKHTSVMEWWEKHGSSWQVVREERARGVPLYFIDEPGKRKPVPDAGAPVDAPDAGARPAVPEGR